MSNDGAAAEQGLSQKIVRALITVILIMVIPGLIGAALAGPEGVSAALLSAIFVLVVVSGSGWKPALLSVPLLAAAAVLGSIWAGTEAWAVLLAALALAGGIAAAWGLLVPFAVAAMLAAAAASVDPAGGWSLVGVGVITALYVVLLLRRLGLPERVPGFRMPLPQAGVAGVILAILVGASATIALNWAEEHAYYFPIFVLALAIPAPGMRISEHARTRLLGTTAGLLATLPLTLIPLSEWAIALLMAVVLCAFLIVKEPLWLNAALSTALIVIVSNPSSGGIAAGETRLVAVATAAVLVVLGGLIAIWFGRRHPGWFDAENWAVPTADAQEEPAESPQPRG